MGGGAVAALWQDALRRLGDESLAPLALLSAQALFRQAPEGQRSLRLKSVLAGIHDCGANARRLRYRLAAHVLRSSPPKPWGAALLGLRDRLVEGAARESHPPALAELRDLAAAVAGAMVQAYLAGEYPALGLKAKPGPEWLEVLLVAPLLQLAARPGSKPQVVSNACALAQAALAGLRQWAPARAVLQAAVGCLREALVLFISRPETLAVQSAYGALHASITLLGDRLRPAAVETVAAVCTSALLQKEWQVRRLAVGTLAALVAAVGAAERPLQALAQLRPSLVQALERLERGERAEQVRQELVPLLQALRDAEELAGPMQPAGDADALDEQQDATHSGGASAELPAGASAAGALEAEPSPTGQAPAAEHPAAQLERWAGQRRSEAPASQATALVTGGGQGAGPHPAEISLRLHLELPAVKIQLRGAGGQAVGSGRDGTYVWAAEAAAEGMPAGRCDSSAAALRAHSIPATLAIQAESASAPAATASVTGAERSPQRQQQACSQGRQPSWVDSFGEILSPLASLATSPLPSFSPPKPSLAGGAHSPEFSRPGAENRTPLQPGATPQPIAAWTASPDQPAGLGADDCSLPEQQQQQAAAEAASSEARPRAERGPLTVMVNRAVSRLAMLQELQETVLAVPPAPASQPQPQPGSTRAGPALSAIAESGEPSPGASLAASSARPGTEAAALRSNQLYSPRQRSDSWYGGEEEGEYPAGREGAAASSGRWRGLEHNPLWDTSRPASREASPDAGPQEPQQQQPQQQQEPQQAASGSRAASAERGPAVAGAAAAAAAREVRASLRLDLGHGEGGLALPMPGEPSPMLQQSPLPGVGQRRHGAAPWDSSLLLSVRSMGSQQGFSQLAEEAELEVEQFLRGSIAAGAAAAAAAAGPAAEWTIAPARSGLVDGEASGAGASTEPGLKSSDPGQVLARLAQLKARLGGTAAAASTTAGAQPDAAALPPRAESPPLAPDLPVSRREAGMLAAAAGRMAGNWGEAAEPGDLRQALVDVADMEAAALQAHYGAALDASLRQSVAGIGGGGGGPTKAQEEVLTLKSAAGHAAQRDLDVFLTQRLPRLAEVLASRDQLLGCLARLDSLSESEGGAAC